MHDNVMATCKATPLILPRPLSSFSDLLQPEKGLRFGVFAIQLSVLSNIFRRWPIVGLGTTIQHSMAAKPLEVTKLQLHSRLEFHC